MSAKMPRVTLAAASTVRMPDVVYGSVGIAFQPLRRLCRLLSKHHRQPQPLAGCYAHFDPTIVGV
jgi:hypothetical protein